jgi:hypothetical protein
MTLYPTETEVSIGEGRSVDSTAISFGCIDSDNDNDKEQQQQQQQQQQETSGTVSRSSTTSTSIMSKGNNDDNNISSTMKTAAMTGDHGDLEAKTKTEKANGENSSQPEDPPPAPCKVLKSYEAVFMLVGLFTVGEIIMIPYAFGQLGYIGGPLLLVGWAVR